jgi:hypothetical protein
LGETVYESPIPVRPETQIDVELLRSAPPDQLNRIHSRRPTPCEGILGPSSHWADHEIASLSHQTDSENERQYAFKREGKLVTISQVRKIAGPRPKPLSFSR